MRPIIGLRPSCLGVTISSMSCRRLSESAVITAFSHTFDANLWRAMFSICPRSFEMINARSWGCPCSRTNWIT